MATKHRDADGASCIFAAVRLDACGYDRWAVGVIMPVALAATVDDEPEPEAETTVAAAA